MLEKGEFDRIYEIDRRFGQIISTAEIASADFMVFRIRRCSNFEILLAANNYEHHNNCENLTFLCLNGFEKSKSSESLSSTRMSVETKKVLNPSFINLSLLGHKIVVETKNIFGQINYFPDFVNLVENNCKSIGEILKWSTLAFIIFICLLFGTIFGIFFQFLFNINLFDSILFSVLSFIAGGVVAWHYLIKASKMVIKIFLKYLKEAKNPTKQEYVFFLRTVDSDDIENYRFIVYVVNLHDRRIIKFPGVLKIPYFSASLKEKMKALIFIKDEKSPPNDFFDNLLGEDGDRKNIFCSIIGYKHIFYNTVLLQKNLSIKKSETIIIVGVCSTYLGITTIYKDGENTLMYINRKEKQDFLSKNDIITAVFGNVMKVKHIIAVESEKTFESSFVMALVKESLKTFDNFDIYPEQWRDNFFETLIEISKSIDRKESDIFLGNPIQLPKMKKNSQFLQQMPYKKRKKNYFLNFFKNLFRRLI